MTNYRISYGIYGTITFTKGFGFPSSSVIATIAPRLRSVINFIFYNRNYLNRQLSRPTITMSARLGVFGDPHSFTYSIFSFINLDEPGILISNLQFIVDFFFLFRTTANYLYWEISKLLSRSCQIQFMLLAVRGKL